jgi:hypothetical protein
MFAPSPGEDFNSLLVLYQRFGFVVVNVRRLEEFELELVDGVTPIIA